MSQHFADSEKPSLFSCATALSSTSGSRPPMTTLQPFAANSRAIPNPIPRLPPVTTAVLPASSLFMQWTLNQRRIHHEGTEDTEKIQDRNQYVISRDRSLASEVSIDAERMLRALRVSVVNRF